MFALMNTAISQEDTTAVKLNEERVIMAPVIKDEPVKNGFFNNWFLGIKGGATFFLSPLKENPVNWGAAASLGKQLNTKIAIRADYLYGKLSSEGNFVKENNDGSFYENDLKADVDFMEISLIMKMSVNDFFYSRSPKYLRELYLFGGGAYTMYRSKVTDKLDNFVMGNGYSESGQQESMEALFAVPLGVGVTYQLDEKDMINLNAEFGYRFAQTGGLSGGLTEKASHYTYTSVGILFNLGKPTLSPQKVTSDMVREDVYNEMFDKLEKQFNFKMVAQIEPIQEELAKQSTNIADNQQQLEILQEEFEARTNAIVEQFGDSNSYSSGGIDMSSVYFAFNSTYVTPAMEREIAIIGKVLKKNKNLNCQVIGNASSEGSPEYNMELSQKRAEAVYYLLVDEFNIDESRLTLINKGLEEPLAETINRINRRVDLILK